MIPVAVSVPASLPISIEMSFDNWAFGTFVGHPR